MMKEYADVFLSAFPYRLGMKLRDWIPDWLTYKKSYYSYRKLVKEAFHFSPDQQKEFIFKKMSKMVAHAYMNIEFYRKFYSEKGFHPDLLKQFDDINRIPIVKKSDLNKVPLMKRYYSKINSFKINTGGTSGQPLNFLLDKQTSAAREWAHMEVIWRRLGYIRNSLRLCFRGRIFGEKKIDFSPFLTEIGINMYVDPEEVAKDLMRHPCFDHIKFLHGYPGLIYETTRQWEISCPLVIEKLAQQIKGLFFSSEYPFSRHRKYLEEKYNTSSVSWYGHSEKAVLAYEKKDPYVYVPFLTYGYAEPMNSSDGVHLVSTAWDNLSHPFIRYDTEDLIEPSFRNDLMNAFKITEGRNSEYILDKNGRKISLTGLIFGRHHELFNYTDFLQISQELQGKATIHVTTQNDEIASPLNFLFNSKNVEIDFSFMIRKKPFRTSNGKTPLLVSGKLIDSVIK